MHKIKDEPFDENDIEKFCLKVNRDMNEILNVYVQNNTIHELPDAPNLLNSTTEYSYDQQSLDFLSMTIQNRLKVEDEEKQLQIMSPSKNALVEQLSKFENVIDEITLKIEE